MSTVNNKRTASSISQILLWFAASVSIAEIMTGTLLAPLGLSKGLLAIVIGHVIGVFILFLAGMIGGKSGYSSAESSRISFGAIGSYGFSILNILQLLGWTAVMIINGAMAMNQISKALIGVESEKICCIIIGLIICLWIALGMKALVRVNAAICVLLLMLSILLGYTVFSNPQSVSQAISGEISFGGAVELNAAMSLSWLPLISDYTRRLKTPLIGTAGSVVSYFFGSMLMFAIGLGAALYTNNSDVATILLTAGFGIAALLLVVFSTVTTTFLDVFSAGVSAANFSKKVNEKKAAVIMCVIGTCLAIFVPITQYENFLYLIGSVFSPLFAILFVDYYIFKKEDISDTYNIKNSILWVIGFILYRLVLSIEFVLGITLPVMVVIALLTYIVNVIFVRKKATEKEIDYSLYLVIGSDNVSEGKICSSIEDAIKGGCTLVQLREKYATSREFIETAKQVKIVTDKYNIPLIINDRIDIAMAINADGIHIGQSDLPAKDARRLLGEDKIIGVSASNLKEAVAAVKDGADYLGIGAMFPTGTKEDANITSIEELKEIREEIKIPLVVIGGINGNTIPIFENCGIDGIAVVSAILAEANIVKATKELKQLFEELQE